MEEILIVSNYYPPEKGAAPNRIEQLALKLSENNYSVSVLCPLANYPKGKLFPAYKNKFSVSEVLDGIPVRRLWIYPSNSHNIFKRILSIMSFSMGLFLYLMFKKTPKKVIVQSPPLLLSFIAVLVLYVKGKKIILNVSDLWPLAAIELGVLKSDTVSHRILKLLEKFIYKKATLVMGQSDEIIAHVKSLVSAKECHLYRNFPDHSTKFDRTSIMREKKIKLFYAGLLGVAQGVLDVCKNMELEELNIEFHIFGDGAEKLAIEEYIRKHPEKNILFHGMLERDELISRLASFDIALVPLKTRIYGSVPSKIFEYSGLGIPILYFGGGEGETIVESYGLGWVADVEDFAELNIKLRKIEMSDRGALEQLKEQVFVTSSKEFNLNRQIKDLINNGVF
jgi:glycosyltransferase involved in cell wall biosynthesis